MRAAGGDRGSSAAAGAAAVDAPQSEEALRVAHASAHCRYVILRLANARLAAAHAARQRGAMDQLWALAAAGGRMRGAHVAHGASAAIGAMAAERDAFAAEQVRVRVRVCTCVCVCVCALCVYPCAFACVYACV